MKIDCRYFEGTETKDGCCAPLCPLMPESLENGIWYADEEICRRRDFAKLPWVKMQKKLAKMNPKPQGYFNLAMLSRNCVVKKGIQGLDPDKPESEQLKKWMKAHPKKKNISKEKRAELRERIKRISKMRKVGDEVSKNIC